MKNLINGEHLDASNGAIIEIVNPANGEFIDSVPNSTSEDVDKAVKSARNAQKSWSKIPMYERGNLLEKFVLKVEERKEELAKLLTSEAGKTIKEAREEISNTKTMVMGYVERAKHLYGINIPDNIEPGTEKSVQYTKRYPVGVVAAIIPFNFPVNFFCHKVACALIMGNTVVVKPSNYTPLTIFNLCDILMEIGIPSGVVQCITGDGQTAGKALAAHPGVDLVSLAGNTISGMQTMEVASKNLTNVSLDLTGNDAFILLDDGDVDLAVEETIHGRLYNAGQVCCASKRFIISNTVKEQFISKLKHRIEELKVGNPLDEETQIGCLVNVAVAKKVEDQVNDLVKLGAKVVLGGKRTGAFYTPTIINNVSKDMPVAKDEEIYGPVISVIGFDTPEEAIAIANQSSYGLCGCVFSGNFSRALKVAERLECGTAVVNGSNYWRSAEMPFGGWKKSGIGYEGISATLEEMSRVKTIVLKNILK